MIEIYTIILSYLEENQKLFLAQWYIDIYRKRRKFFFQVPIQPHSSFGFGLVTNTKNLKS